MAEDPEKRPDRDACAQEARRGASRMPGAASYARKAAATTNTARSAPAMLRSTPPKGRDKSEKGTCPTRLSPWDYDRGGAGASAARASHSAKQRAASAADQQEQKRAKRRRRRQRQQALLREAREAGGAGTPGAHASKQQPSATARRQPAMADACTQTVEMADASTQTVIPHREEEDEQRHGAPYGGASAGSSSPDAGSGEREAKRQRRGDNPDTADSTPAGGEQQHEHALKRSEPSADTQRNPVEHMRKRSSENDTRENPSVDEEPRSKHGHGTNVVVGMPISDHPGTPPMTPMPLAKHARGASGADTQPITEPGPEPKRCKVDGDADGGEQATATQADGTAPGADVQLTSTDALRDDGGEQPLSGSKVDRQRQRKREKKRRQREKKVKQRCAADEQCGEQDTIVASSGMEHNSDTTQCSDSTHPLVTALQLAFPRALPWVIERQVKNCQALYFGFIDTECPDSEEDYVADYIDCVPVEESDCIKDLPTGCLCDLPIDLVLDSPFAPGPLSGMDDVYNLGIKYLPHSQSSPPAYTQTPRDTDVLLHFPK